MTLSENLLHISYDDQLLHYKGSAPEAGERHGQRSGTRAILGLNNFITTELDTYRQSAIMARRLINDKRITHA